MAKILYIMKWPLVDNVVGIKRAELGPVGLFCTVINPAPTSGSRSNDSKCRLQATGLPLPPLNWGSKIVGEFAIQLIKATVLILNGQEKALVACKKTGSLGNLADRKAI